jgi:hypothetical protein
MTEIDLSISSKDKFLNKLENSIDNNNPGIFKCHKQKYSGKFNSEGFNLVENRVKINYPIFYRINGEMNNQKVKIKIQLLNRVYITIGMFFICGLLFLFIPFKNDIQGIWLIVTPGLFFVILWIYKFSMRKNIIIEDFKKMTKLIKKVQNN